MYVCMSFTSSISTVADEKLDKIHRELAEIREAEEQFRCKYNLQDKEIHHLHHHVNAVQSGVKQQVQETINIVAEKLDTVHNELSEIREAEEQFRGKYNLQDKEIHHLHHHVNALQTGVKQQVQETVNTALSGWRQEKLLVEKQLTKVMVRSLLGFSSIVEKYNWETYTYLCSFVVTKMAATVCGLCLLTYLCPLPVEHLSMLGSTRSKFHHM